MKDLPEKYAELVRLRPEMAVTQEFRPGKECTLTRSDRFPNWEWRCHSGVWSTERDDCAASLIESKLVRELPNGCQIRKANSTHWAIATPETALDLDLRYHPDPLSALFAFHLSNVAGGEK